MTDIDRTVFILFSSIIHLLALSKFKQLRVCSSKHKNILTAPGASQGTFW